MLIKKVVAWYTEEQLKHSDLVHSYQSAYRRGHSRETALFKVHSDNRDALDEGPMAALIVLDLTAVFHVIHHRILHYRSI